MSVRSATQSKAPTLVTSEALVAFSRCQREAYLLMFTNQQGKPHDYSLILEQRQEDVQRAFLASLEARFPHAPRGENLKQAPQLAVNGILQTASYCAHYGLLTKIEDSSKLGHYHYEPTVFAGTHKPGREHRLELLFLGKVLEQLQGKSPAFGAIVGASSKPKRVRIAGKGTELPALLGDLHAWVTQPPPEAPPVILNGHCPVCRFRQECAAAADRDDSIGAMRGVTKKLLDRYGRKGIFTIKQLSFLYRPPRRSKRRKPPLVRKLELQALAIRTNKIYIQERPDIARQPTELFLDIEGDPDRDYYYLFGLLIRAPGRNGYEPIWSDTLETEKSAWERFLARVRDFGDAPIYHYGNYEAAALRRLSKRYLTSVGDVLSRLRNVNTYLYAKVYFPVRTNSLKELAQFLGASWTSPEPSGLQCLVWRLRWEDSGSPRVRSEIKTYNREDCEHLHLLTEKLSGIREHAESLPGVDFADNPKTNLPAGSSETFKQFASILTHAHLDYEERKIRLRNRSRKRRVPTSSDITPGPRSRRRNRSRLKPNKVVAVARGTVCPNCTNRPLKPTDTPAELVIIDLVFTGRAVRRTVVKYTGWKGRCSGCQHDFNPPAIRRFRKGQKYGHGLQVWSVYHRLVLRLPYVRISQLLEDMFQIHIGTGGFVNFLRHVANYYTPTETLLLTRLLESPSLHVDETTVNIQGTTHYVWVFTDGKHVVFRLTESREAVIVHELLKTYKGVLISDFYAGYDALACRQQKCWAHLLRDLNEDLRRAPFDAEFQDFVEALKAVILPIFKAVERYGLKKRHLNRFRSPVERFYAKYIDAKTYRSEIARTYQKRFLRYRESLFLFLEEDGVPWNNNMAERALRHLAVQRKISGSFFKSGLTSYLLLLAVTQTCRFQNKSFLEFLLSGERDVDGFKRRKRAKAP